jgi:hypothetical protein
MKKYGKRKGSSSKKFTKAKRRVVKPASGMFKKKVLSVIQDQAEDKSICTTPDPGFLPYTLNAVSDLRELVPDIGIGANDHQRLGRQIRAKSLMIWGHLELQNAISFQSYPGPTRVMVRLLVISDKRVGQYDAQTSTFLNNILDLGSSTTNLDGTTGGPINVRSMYLPLDRNTVTVHYDKLFYLDAPKWVNPTGLQLTSTDVGKTIKMFKIRVPCKKVLKYTDSSNSPTNFAPYLTGCYFTASGDANTQNLVKLNFTTKFVWEDM